MFSFSGFVDHCVRFTKGAEWKPGGGHGSTVGVDVGFGVGGVVGFTYGSLKPSYRQPVCSTGSSTLVSKPMSVSSCSASRISDAGGF